MRKRSVEILRKFLRQEKRIFTIEELAKSFKVSARTIRNDIAEINEFLSPIAAPPVTFDSKGTFIRPKTFNAAEIEDALRNMTPYDYKLSSEERLIYIIVSLLNTQGYNSMQILAQELFVSRATIIGDFESLRGTLKKFDVQIISDAGKGIALKCSASEKVNILADLFRQITLNTRQDGFFQNFILRKMEIRHSFPKVFAKLQEYAKINSLIFDDEEFYNLAVYIFAMLNAQKFYRDDWSESPAIIDSLGQMLIYVAQIFNVRLTGEMLKDFREYTQAHELSLYVKSVDEMDLYKAIIRFLSELDKKLELTLAQDNVLINALLLHIKSMKDWGNTQIEIPQDEMIFDYNLLCRLVEENADILESFLNYRLKDEMKKSIVIHICVALIRNRSYIDQLSVVIICPGSMATGKYLEVQVKNYFDFHIAGVFTASEAEKMLEELAEPIDFVLSTVDLKLERHKVLKVNPFLQADDLNLIQRHSLKKRKGVISAYERRRIEFLQKAAQALHEDIISPKIYETLARMMTEFEQQKALEKKNALAELLTVEKISVVYERLNWKDAIRRAGKILLDDGNISSEYVSKCIENVEEYGDYIIVGEKVALAHANKKYGVNRDGLSLLVAPEGILFDTEGDEVNLMFCFASTGEKDYLELLQTIMRIGRIAGKVSELCSMSDAEKIYRELVKI